MSIERLGAVDEVDVDRLRDSLRARNALRASAAGSRSGPAPRRRARARIGWRSIIWTLMHTISCICQDGVRIRQHGWRKESAMNAPLDLVRKPSVCPHDCPSVCALDVEVIGGRRIGRVHGAPEQSLHGGRRLRESRALCRAHPPSRPPDASRCCASGRRAPGSSRRSAGTRRSTASPSNS